MFVSTPFFNAHHHLNQNKVGEDDYHQLKHDQCLRVDFKSFPRKFIELLKSCGGGLDSANAPEHPSPAGVVGRDNDCAQDGASWRRSQAKEAGTGNSSSSAGPSFLARLETLTSGGSSVFSLVETNPFKELTHLSLKFRAGNDTAIKTYLAARLRQVRRSFSFSVLFLSLSLCLSFLSLYISSVMGRGWIL